MLRHVKRELKLTLIASYPFALFLLFVFGIRLVYYPGGSLLIFAGILGVLLLGNYHFKEKKEEYNIV